MGLFDDPQDSYVAFPTKTDRQIGSSPALFIVDMFVEDRILSLSLCGTMWYNVDWLVLPIPISLFDLFLSIQF